MSDELELGDLAQDVITGFTGVVVADTLWIHGCRRLNLAPREMDKDGKMKESMSFDVPSLKLLEKAVVPASNRIEATERARAVEAPPTERKKPGGPRPTLSNGR